MPPASSFSQAAADIGPGCILLDVRMPEMDGLEVQQALRDRGILLPVVVITGHGDISLAVEAMKAGAVDFIEKPFDEGGACRRIEEGFRAARASEPAPRAAPTRPRLGSRS